MQDQERPRRGFARETRVCSFFYMEYDVARICPLHLVTDPVETLLRATFESWLQLQRNGCGFVMDPITTTLGTNLAYHLPRATAARALHLELEMTLPHQLYTPSTTLVAGHAPHSRVCTVPPTH